MELLRCRKGSLSYMHQMFIRRMKRIGAIRQQIGKPTIFNLVGPLTNPLPLKTQFTGINRPDFMMEYASVLQMLGRERAIVVSGAGGMDEASLAGQNAFVLLDKGDLIPFSLTAEEVGLAYAPAFCDTRRRCEGKCSNHSFRFSTGNEVRILIQSFSMRVSGCLQTGKQRRYRKVSNGRRIVFYLDRRFRN